MTTAAHPATHASHDAHAEETHHPNYMAIFIWLIILTAIEVTIPEVFHPAPVGHDPMTPALIGPEALTAGDFDAEVAAAFAPNERFHPMGWTVRIVSLTFLAIAKAALVGMFFMHLKYDGWKLNFILAAPTALFVVIIVLLAPDIAISWPRIFTN